MERGFVDKNAERMMLFMRVGQIKSVIRSRIFSMTEDTGTFEFRDGQAGTPQGEGAWRSFGKEEFWGSKEQYCQFRQTVVLGEKYKGKKVVYEVSPFLYKNWNDSVQQFLLYINGKLVQGLDSHHTFALLTDCAEGGERYDILLHAYCDDWKFCGQAQLKASTKAVNEAVNKLYYDIDTLWETAKQLGADDNARVDIITALNDAVNLLELENPDEAVFAASVDRAEAYLRQHIFGVRNDVVISCIGHTHIDVAWLWRLRQTREKAGRSFATVIAYMKEFPEYKFMSPQAQLYDYVKQDYPALFEEIREMVKQGRWEAEGSMWVESDTNVISGESLVRQFMYGKRFFRENFGVDNKIMWLPDVFGYSGALPQIMKLADIDYFMTTKISWCEFDRFPFDTFMWEGIDGTKILSHFAPARDEADDFDWFTTYNADISPAYAINTWKRYSDKDLNRTVLCSYGHGDGGGGPTREMLERMRRMHEGIPGCPDTKQAFAREFFDDLKKEVSGSPRLPKWRGELYLEYHRGTLTAQARNKKYNRKSEWLYHDVETLAETAHLINGDEYPDEKIDEGWKLILLNQFHDIIPGSSIAPVYEDSKAQYEELTAAGKQMEKTAIASVLSQVKVNYPSVCVFNTLGFDRTETVITDLPFDGDITVIDSDGCALPSQITHDGKLLFLAKGVPAKGYKLFTVANTESDFFAPVNADSKQAETDDYRLTFDDNMNIASLYFKDARREVAKGEILGLLTAYEDRSHQYEAWDIKCYYNQKSWDVTAVDSVEVLEKGAVRTVIRVVRPFNTSVITQDYIFYAHTRRIDMEFHVDWKEKNVALKMDFPVDVNTDKATFDIQFGSIERSTTENTLRDFAQFEVCGHKWADLSDSGFGFSVMNDCKYGWNVKNGHIRPTLLRSATNPNVNQDREHHDFTYALYPHLGQVNDKNNRTVTESYSLNAPLKAVFVTPQEGRMPAFFRLIGVNQPNIIIETVKKAEGENDAMVVRMYESANRTTECCVTTAFPFDTVYTCGVLETGDKKLAEADDAVDLTFRPFEIKTLKIYFNPTNKENAPDTEIRDYRTTVID